MPLPMLVTESGISSEVMFCTEAKALSAIEVTFMPL